MNTKALEKVSVIPNGDAPAMMPIPQIPATQSLISVLSRAMSDPSIDVEKVERYAALYERAIAREAETAFNEAMRAAQEEMRPIAANADNPQTRSRYAKYDALDGAVRPIYSKHGFSLSFYQGEGAPEGHIRVQCKVSRGGHTERPYLDMPADGKGAKGGDVMTKTHATGAGVTYGRRYLLGMIFNLVVGEDNDGNDASAGPARINNDQATELVALIREVGGVRHQELETSLLKYFGFERLNDIPASEFTRAKAAINRKRAR
ncbi:MAG: phage related protein [Bradyrhizobium sp.]|nr:phage related protein [Bradyrhizobium sp.]